MSMVCFFLSQMITVTNSAVLTRSLRVSGFDLQALGVALQSLQVYGAAAV